MKRRRRTAPALVALAAWLVAGCGSQGDTTGEESREVLINVRTLTVTRTSLPEYVTLSGALSPIRGADISTEEAGVVREVPNDRGQRVARGDLLVMLDRELLEADRNAAAAARDLAEYNESRSRKLFEANQLSRQEMLRIESVAAEARARADVARLRWERAGVSAPFDGLVAERYVEIGELVSAGTRVARVVDPYTLEVRGAVSEREAAWIRPGAQAAVTVDGVDDVLPGRVHWISVEAAVSTGKFRVEVRVDNPDLELRPGVVARAEILKRVHEDVVVVPRDALLMQTDGPVAFVVRAGRAVRRLLKLGADQGLMVAVQSGLNDGEQLIVRGQRQLHDGSLVAVREQATALDGSIASDPIDIRATEAFTPLLTDSTGTDDAEPAS